MAGEKTPLHKGLDTLHAGFVGIQKVRAAAKNSGDAKSHLDELTKLCDQKKNDLNHREFVHAHFNSIVTEQNALKDSATTRIQSTSAAINTYTSQQQQLQAELSRLRELHTRELAPLKKELSAARDIQNNAEKLLRECEQARKNAESQLEREQAAQNERAAEASQPRQSLQSHVWTQQQSVEEARRELARSEQAHRYAREVYESKQNAADAEELERTNQINDLELRIQDTQKQHEAAMADLAKAEETLQDAQDINASPDRTNLLRSEINQLQSQIASQQHTVDQLNTIEKDLRRRTRLSRFTLIGVVALSIVVLLVILWLIFRPR